MSQRPLPTATNNARGDDARAGTVHELREERDEEWSVHVVVARAGAGRR